MLCKSCVHWRKKAPQENFQLGKGQTVCAGPTLAEKKAVLENLCKIDVCCLDSVKHFHTSQSLYLLSLCSFLSSIKAFTVSRNCLKGWTCTSILLVNQKLSRLFNCLCLSDWIVEWWDRMVCAIQHWCCWDHVCDQIESFGFKALFARKVLWIVLWSALIVLMTALLHLVAPVHVLVYISSSSVFRAQNKYNYSTSFLFKFPAGIFSAWNQCLPVCLWNFLRK